MKVFEKYFYKILIHNTLLVLVFLMLIFSLFRLIDEISSVNDVDYTFGSAFAYVIFQSPEIILELSTLSIFLGVISAFSKMSENSEIEILYSSGISRYKLISKAISFGFSASLILLVLTETFGPILYLHGESFKASRVKDYQTFFGESNVWLKNNNTLIKIGSNLGDQIEDVVVFNFEDNDLKSIFRAKEGQISRQELSLNNVQKIFINNNKYKYLIDSQIDLAEVLNFSTLKDKEGYIKREPDRLSIIELIEIINISILNNINSTKYESELYKKIVIPLNVATMIFFLLPYFINHARDVGVKNKIFFGTLFAVGYHLISKIFIVLSESISSFPFLANLMPALLFITLGYILHFKRNYSYG